MGKQWDIDVNFRMAIFDWGLKTEVATIIGNRQGTRSCGDAA
jgi:hypothetical protein